MTKIPKISLVLACYNEASHFNNSMKRLLEILNESKYSYEIIFVDDLSKDNTRDLIKEFCSKHENTRYLFHKVNTGRGGAVTDGIKIALGDFVGFIDIDLEIDASYIPKLIKKLEEGYDGVNAYRTYNYTIKEILRVTLSRGCAFLVRHLLKTPLKDPAAGLKFFKKDKIIKILEQTEDKHWFWEVEILVRSYHDGLKLTEIPCIFIKKPEKKSTVKLFGDTIHYFTKIIQFRSKMRKWKA